VSTERFDPETAAEVMRSAVRSEFESLREYARRLTTTLFLSADPAQALEPGVDFKTIRVHNQLELLGAPVVERDPFLAGLRADIAEGIAEADRGEGVPADQVMADLHARIMRIAQQQEHDEADA